MFSRPNKDDPPYLIADFMEFQCLMSGQSVSTYDLRATLSMPDDENHNEGIESSDDESIDILDDAIGVCSSRAVVCNSRYPFNVERNSINIHPEASWYKEIYTFMLLATRLNMNTQKIQGGEDATKLFELLCTQVAKEYFGGHALTMAFGTSVEGGFKEKLKKMLDELHISASLTQPEGSTGRQKDGSVDVVVWIPCADNKDSQLIAMGQCKTGTSWEGMLRDLDPDSLFKCHTTKSPYSEVVRTFFLAESFGNHKWEERCRNAGILFDRTRIMEFLPPELRDNLLERIKKWNTAAIENERKNIE